MAIVKPIRREIRRMLRAANIGKAIREADLNWRESAMCRMAVFFAPEKIENELFNQAQAEGLLPGSLEIDGDVEETNVQAIDWQKFAEFLQIILPIVFQFIFALMKKPDA